MPGAAEFDRVRLGLEQFVDLGRAVDPLQEGVDGRHAEELDQGDLLLRRQGLPREYDHLLLEEGAVDFRPRLVR